MVIDRNVRMVQRQEFARRLRALMRDRNMSQSDLARKIYGEDKKGGAKNRYRIESYYNGRNVPRAESLAQLSKALGVEPDDLVPALDASQDQDPLVSYEQISRTEARLGILPHKMAVSKAIRIIEILNEPDE